MRPLALAAAVLLLAGCSGSARPPQTGAASSRAGSPGVSGSRGVDGTSATSAVPRFAHIVVVVEENRPYSAVIGSPDAPYLNAIAASGTLLTRSFGVTHPSEPNYLALFSGSTHGLTDDSCPHRYGTGNLAAQLRTHGLSFVGYAESLPTAGYLGCYTGAYARKHAPWTDFTDLPRGLGRPMRDFPTDYTRLPRVAFVVPNLEHDMHDGSVAAGDRWLRAHLGGYLRWARTHNSLLVVTWDEDDTSAGNHIPGLLAGAHVAQSRFRGRVDHYTLLRTLEAAYGLRPLGAAARRTPITGIWTS